jgi:uncharacterized protein YegL
MSAPVPHVHLYVLLDRSGSMASMAEQVVAGFNKLLADQQADGHDARMTLVQFDSHDPREVVANAVPIAEVVPLTHDTFAPRGGTPLLDATGRLIGKASGRAVDLAAAGSLAEQVLFVTITDGEENQSCEFSRRQIIDLVQAKQEVGWTFVFLGAGLDAYAEAGGMGYGAGSVQAWAPDGTGAALAFDSLSAKTRDFRAAARHGFALKRDDFFEGDKPAEDDRRKRGGKK